MSAYGGPVSLFSPSCAGGRRARAAAEVGSQRCVSSVAANVSTAVATVCGRRVSVLVAHAVVTGRHGKTTADASYGWRHRAATAHDMVSEMMQGVTNARPGLDGASQVEFGPIWGGQLRPPRIATPDPPLAMVATDGLWTHSSKQRPGAGRGQRRRCWIPTPELGNDLSQTKPTSKTPEHHTCVNSARMRDSKSGGSAARKSSPTRPSAPPAYMQCSSAAPRAPPSPT